MEEKDTTRPQDVTAIKGSLEQREDMQNGKAPSHSPKGDTAKSIPTERTSELVENNAKAPMASKAMHKKKMTSKSVWPIKPYYIVNLTKSRN